MGNSYIKKCFDLSLEEGGGFACIVRNLVKAWQDPKYDVDILLCITHLTWAISAVFGIYYPDSFRSYFGAMIAQYGSPFLWYVMAVMLGIGHYLSIFLHRPIFRLPIFVLSAFWGLSISSALYLTVGPNIPSMIYLVLFVYAPLRKITCILRSSVQDFRKESQCINNPSDMGKCDERGEQS